MDELVITRVFEAPRDLVFRAWTERDRFVRWWGPKGCTTPVCDIRVQPGGVIRVCMRPEEQDVWLAGVFQDVAPPSRLVFTLGFTDEEGNRVSPAEYGLQADWPEETLVTVTFEEHDGKTTQTMRQGPVPAGVPDTEGARTGWEESFDRLAALVVER